MNAKRGKEQIISQILTVCRDGAIKTQIVYQVNLNFMTVRPFLDLLLKKGLLKASQNRRTMYQTTREGERALKILLEAEAITSCPTSHQDLVFASQLRTEGCGSMS